MATAYGDSTLPAGVGNSVAISGSVLFDTTGYLGSSDLEYSNGSGTSYSYSDQIMSHTVRVGGLEWQMNGGQLSLFQESPEDKKNNSGGVDIRGRLIRSISRFCGLL